MTSSGIQLIIQMKHLKLWNQLLGEYNKNIFSVLVVMTFQLFKVLQRRGQKEFSVSNVFTA